jgi:RNA polymerase-binding transcription factor DksA
MATSKKSSPKQSKPIAETTAEPAVGTKSEKPVKADKPAPAGKVAKAAPAASPAPKNGKAPVVTDTPKKEQAKAVHAPKPATVSPKAAKSPAKDSTEAKTSNPAATKPSQKKASVAAFTMEDVHQYLKNRREEARERASRNEASLKKAIPVIADIQPQQQRVLGAATLADILGFGAPSPVAQAVETTRNREVAPKFAHYFELLSALKSKVQERMSQRGRMALGKGDAETAPIPPQDDDDSFDHDFALSLVATEQEAMIEIDAAIERIYEGSYGICEITGKPIAPERLEAVPFARYSVEGQAQFERMNRRRSQRTTSFLDAAEDTAAFAAEESEE